MRFEIRFLALASCLLVAPGALPAQSSGQAKDSGNSNNMLLPPSEDLVRAWENVGNKLVEMAQDFPEDKYDFKVQKDQRTFAETILHVAGDNLLAVSAVKGSQVGPDFHGEPPPRATYKTKADVVKLIKEAVVAGSTLIEAQGDAGLDKPVLSPYTADVVRTSTLWWGVIEDEGEHYGQLVVYYRANNMVPRPRASPEAD